MIPNRIISLCTGIGGLDLAVKQVYGGEVCAFSDIEPASIATFGRHHSGVPNLGDMSRIDWSGSGSVDILTGGWPCQDISNAGLRKGIEGERSGLYVHVLRAVRELRPRLVVLENVAVVTRRGGATVVRGLTEAGYDVRWLTVRASEACGACHPRDRWFAVASLRHAPRVQRQRAWRLDVEAEPVATGDAGGAAQNTHGEPGQERRGAASEQEEGRRSRADAGRRNLLPTPLASDGSHGGPNARHSDGSWKLPAIGHLIPDPDTWGIYAQAIARWSALIGRPAPNPHDYGPRGGLRVAAPFVEWMMGYDEGWVTDTPGLTYGAKMARLGNAVMPQHAAAALLELEAIR